MKYFVMIEQQGVRIVVVHDKLKAARIDYEKWKDTSPAAQVLLCVVIAG